MATVLIAQQSSITWPLGAAKPIQGLTQPPDGVRMKRSQSDKLEQPQTHYLNKAYPKQQNKQVSKNTHTNLNRKGKTDLHQDTKLLPRSLNVSLWR